MSYCAIKNSSTGYVITADSTTGAVTTQVAAIGSGSYIDSQLWEFVPSPTAAGHYYIVSKLNGYVLSATAAAEPVKALVIAERDLFVLPVGDDSQLWQFVLDPAGSGSYFVQNLFNGNVVDVWSGSGQPGAGLATNVLLLTGNASELWEASDGAFPPAVQTVAPPAGLGGQTNYMIIGGTNPQEATPIESLTVAIYFSEQLEVNSPLGFQLNGFSPVADPRESTYQAYQMNWFQQFIPTLQGGPNGLYSHVENIAAPGWQGYVFENKIPAQPFAPTPSGNLVIPQGWTLWLTLLYKPGFVLNGMFCQVVDDTGAVQGTPQNYTLLGKELGKNYKDDGSIALSDLAPALAFQMDIVGAGGGTDITLTSGAGTITYLSENPVSVSNYWPPNSAGGPYGADGTLEKSNSTYGPIVPLGSLGGRLDLPGAPTYRFVQSFGHA
jgi:hypothetical protein